jgi:hypothetical protein
MSERPRLNPHRQRHVERLRRAGGLVLAISVGIAMFVYRIGVVNHEPTIQELLPRTATNIERQRGLLFGRTGATIIGWFEFFEQPAGQAALIVMGGIVSAAALYQVAHRIEIEEG